MVRFFQATIALFVLSVIIFAIGRLSGNPVDYMLPVDATEESRTQLIRTLGLDKPYPEQYAIFLQNAVRGDFGSSLRARLPVIELIKQRLGNSVRLGVVGMFFATVMALTLGVLAALKKGTVIDSIAKLIAVLGQSVPTFWLAIVLIQVFAVTLGVLPAAGMGGVGHYVLPGFSMGLFTLAAMMRLVRSEMLDVLDSEFVKLARIKGVPERLVIWKHALRNALIPVVTWGAVSFAGMVSHLAVVEVVFAWPGMGRLMYDAIMYRDYPALQGAILVGASIVILANLVVDVLYAYLDPRIRY